MRQPAKSEDCSAWNSQPEWHEAMQENWRKVKCKDKTRKHSNLPYLLQSQTPAVLSSTRVCRSQVGISTHDFASRPAEGTGNGNHKGFVCLPQKCGTRERCECKQRRLTQLDAGASWTFGHCGTLVASFTVIFGAGVLDIITKTFAKFRGAIWRH